MVKGGYFAASPSPGKSPLTEEGGRARARCFVGNRPEPLSLEKEPLPPPPPRPCQESSRTAAFVSPAEPLEETGTGRRTRRRGE